MHVSNGGNDLAGVVAISASAGGVEALTQLAAGLSTDLPYTFLIALHSPKPADALFPTLPATAANAGLLDYQVTAADVGTILGELPQREIDETDPDPDTALNLEHRFAMAAGHGPMHRRYTQFADETEQALAVLSERRGGVPTHSGAVGD